MTKSDDLAQIIIGCKNKDSKCFSQIVDMYASRCYGYFYRLTGNNDVSDELLSELFVKLVEKIASYKGGSFDGWKVDGEDPVDDEEQEEEDIEGQWNPKAG